MLFDTHAHYDDERYGGELDGILNALADSGVGLALNAGSGMAQSRRGLEIARKYGFVYAAAGVHPHEAEQMTDADIDELRVMLREPKCVALGEIGLDYHYDFSPREVQRRRFAQQLELARETDMPVIVHEREAFADVMEILSDFGGLRLVVHCFSGDTAAAERVIERGWLVSFNGIVTFRKNKSLEVAAAVPLEYLLLETDAPYLAPDPVRGTLNDSRNLKYIAAKIAEARGITAEELAAATTENGKRFFGIN
ncbi:MAG: TatD family hydrolase [Oscillospiraceae bacterium]|jgi:TatD DNase family protein|nr:TatD family hydrolase [Oscillospiraceae bacterium]